MTLPDWLVLDFEGRCRHSIKKVTRLQYASDPSSGVICIGLKWGDKARAHIPAEGAVFTREHDHLRCPEEVLTCLEHGIPIVAHNSTFERSIWYHVCVRVLGWPEIPYELWRDTQPVCLYYGLPRKLEFVCDALNLPRRKDMEGHKAMLQCATPRRYSKKAIDKWEATNGWRHEMELRWWEEPEKLDRIYKYCVSDVEAQDELLRTIGYLPPDRQTDYDFDERINERGIPIDWAHVHAALQLIKQAMEDYDSRLAEITATHACPQGVVKGRNQLKQMKEFARQHGVELDSLDKAVIETTLSIPGLPNVVREVLNIRAESGKASLAKLEKMLSLTDEDGRCRHTMVWHGAATGRKSGQGIQPHNFPSRTCLSEEEANQFHECLATSNPTQSVRQMLDAREERIEVPDLISAGLRSFIKAEEGKTLFVSDFSAIETRILAWLARCPLLYNAFVKGECVYRQFAGRIYKVDPLSIAKKDPMRQVGKVAVLGLGYGMGPDKFWTSASGPPNNIDINLDMSTMIVTMYRATYPEVMQFHKDCEKAFRHCIQNHGQMAVGRVVFGCNGEWGWIVLPSGRPIWFREPKLARVKNRWRDDGSMTSEIQYKGVHPTRKNWTIRSTYGGSLVESICQATTACVMQEAMVRVEQQGGFPVILTVHDEVVAEADERMDLKLFDSLMRIRPAWAQDLPIEVESQTRKRYGK